MERSGEIRIGGRYVGQQDVLEKKLGDILLEGDVECDHYRELYWSSKDDKSRSRALVVAHGSEAVSMLREAMTLLRSEENVSHDMFVYNDGVHGEVKLQTGFDAPGIDLCRQRDDDLDAIISVISDMARTYPDSPEEQRAIHEAQSVVAMPDEKIAKVLQAVLILADSCGVSVKDVSRYIALRRRPAWVLRHFSDELEKHL